MVLFWLNSLNQYLTSSHFLLISYLWMPEISWNTVTQSPENVMNLLGLKKKENNFGLDSVFNSVPLQSCTYFCLVLLLTKICTLTTGLNKYSVLLNCPQGGSKTSCFPPISWIPKSSFPKYLDIILAWIMLKFTLPLSFHFAIQTECTSKYELVLIRQVIFFSDRWVEILSFDSINCLFILPRNTIFWFFCVTRSPSKFSDKRSCYLSNVKFDNFFPLFSAYSVTMAFTCDFSVFK